MCHYRTSCSAVIRRSWRWRTRLSSSCGRAWNFERLSKLRLENRGAGAVLNVSSFSSGPSHDGRVGNGQSRQSGAVQGGAASKTALPEAPEERCMATKLHHVNLCSNNVPEMDRFY